MQGPGYSVDETHRRPPMPRVLGLEEASPPLWTSGFPHCCGEGFRNFWVCWGSGGGGRTVEKGCGELRKERGDPQSFGLDVPPQ